MAVLGQVGNTALNTGQNNSFPFAVPVRVCWLLRNITVLFNYYNTAGGQLGLQISSAKFGQIGYAAPASTSNSVNPFQYTFTFGEHGLLLPAQDTLTIAGTMGGPSGAGVQFGFFIYGDVLDG